MPRPRSELDAHQREAFPGASMRRPVYAALKVAMGGELHALVLDIRTREEG